MKTRFKLDENVSRDWSDPLRTAGHDVATVSDQALRGATDPDLAEACRREGRCLLTTDDGFAQILDYPPERYPGLVVLRHPKPTLLGMKNLVVQIAGALEGESPAGRLWIVEPGRIRVHEPPTGA